MGVSGVSGNYNTGKTTTVDTSKETQNNQQTAANTADEAAVYEKSPATDTTKKTYTRDTVKLGELRAKDAAYVSSLQNLVNQLVNQVNKNNMAKGGDKFNGAKNGQINPSKVDSYWDVLVDNGDGTFSFNPNLSAEARQALINKAKEDIGEDGYYGVKQTSQRILDFAKAITGGDPSKIESMRNMVQKAFDEVEHMLGGLPDISRQTYDAIMEGFDEWAAQTAE